MINKIVDRHPYRRMQSGLMISFIISVIFFFGCSPAPLTDGQYGMLTPPAKASPHINGPVKYGIRPGSPFLYRIPCTGQRPIVFSAENLPEDLVLDPASGIIFGVIDRAGEYEVTLVSKNKYGSDSRKFDIVAGDRLALTPPMGWNSWYIHYNRVSDKLMRGAADQMDASGMADYGYQYVNIDDCWMVKDDSNDPEIGGNPRDRDGRLIPNKRFPDMAGLARYIHSLGLKAGIYISPGPRTCGGYEGSYGHEALDAKTFTEWGFDFLKYDWCSYGELVTPKTREDFMKPYLKMSAELKKQPRDIVLNLCQYGMGNVWEWGGEAGQCWRTTGDLGLEKGSDLPGFYQIGFSNAAHGSFARPGAWNDPDYILIGTVGDANNMGMGHPTTLTHNEQYSYMSMWCLMAAPLIFSGDMSKLDAFTLNVLCNSEVIDVDQDPLGRQARIISKTGEEFILAKDMEDGSKAVGLFNLTNKLSRITLDLNLIGIDSPVKMHDLWRQTDISTIKNRYQTWIPAHGVSLVRTQPVR